MADSIAASRVRREINEFQKKADCAGIVLELEDNDLMKLKGSITGPPDTSYAGGTYKLAIGMSALFIADREDSTGIDDDQ